MSIHMMMAECESQERNGEWEESYSYCERSRATQQHRVFQERGVLIM